MALVAHAGEGCRRVVAEHAFALNGSGAQIGEIKTGLNSVSQRLDFVDHEMRALQLCGEGGGLYLVLSAPCSTGSSTQDLEKSFIQEVLRMMLEFSMVDDLLHGVWRILLHHTLDPQVASALIQNFEVFMRGSVIYAFIDLVEKA